MKSEIWKDIPGYEGYYQVSNEGRVKSLDRTISRLGKDRFIKGKLFSLSVSGSNPYYSVSLSKKGVIKKFRVHTLVAMAFLDHKPCGYEAIVDHINRNTTDNRVENLRVVSARESAHNRKNGDSSKLLGAYWCNTDKSWISRIKVDGKPHLIGYFKSDKDASKAYKDVCERYESTGVLDYSMYKKTVTSKYKGVHYDKRERKWLTRFDIAKNKKIFIGSFHSEVEAKNAYEDVVGTYRETGVLNEYKYKKRPNDKKSSNNHK
jgi:hypothetical protein